MSDFGDDKRPAALAALVLLLVLGLSARASSAQQVGSLATVFVRSDLGAIEAEAMTYPELPASHDDPLYWRDNPAPGTDGRRCVAVPQEGPVRSGDFTIWYNSMWRPRAGEQHKVAWGPSENSTEMVLRVRAQLIGDPAASFSVESGLGRLDRPGAVRREDEWFFPSGITFSRPGDWVVVATSGRNWGCFLFQVEEAAP